MRNGRSSGIQTAVDCSPHRYGSDTTDSATSEPPSATPCYQSRLPPLRSHGGTTTTCVS